MDESDFSLSVSFFVIVTLLVFVVLGLGLRHMVKLDRRLRRVRRMHRLPPK